MRGMTYIELSYEVISKFVGPEDIPTAKLKDIIHRSFSTFRTPGNVCDRGDRSTLSKQLVMTFADLVFYNV